MKNATVPAKKTLLLFIIPLVFIIVSFLMNIFLTIAVISDIILFLIILIDLFLSPDYRKKIEINIKPVSYLILNKYSELTLTVKNKNKLPANLNILFDLDISFDRNYSTEAIRVMPSAEEEYNVKLFANRRGKFRSEKIFTKSKSLLGLLVIYKTFKCSLDLTVVPTAFSKGDSFRFLQKKIIKIEGSQKNRSIGNGKEFMMLRDYIKGDDFGKIDWKATARRIKPITRVYRLENNFEVALMLDCGRLLGTEANELSLLDYAINSSVVLSYAAVKGNDNVSLTAFNRDIIKYIPPSKNLKAIKKMNYILTELQYDFVESDYKTAFRFIKSKLTKRSLVVFFTDIIDDSNINIYHKYLSLLKKKHAVLLILLRDKNLFNIANSVPSRNVNLYTKAAGIDLIIRRNKTIHNLKKLGIDVLDLFPEEVTSAALNKYLNIKGHS